MTAALQHQAVSSDRPARAATVPPDPDLAAEFLTITARPSPSGVVITVRGEVDLFSSPVLRDGLLALVHDAGPPLIIDLTAVGFFGAAGLTVLATVREAALAVGTGLCLVAHTRRVLLPLTITGMHTLFDIYPDVACALSRAGDPDR